MTKYGKSTFPPGTCSSDFKCYGTLACKDTEFAGTRMAEMGCFQQEGVDSDKYFVAQMVTDPKGNWYLYSEWGRKGASNPQFQFSGASNEAEAQKLYEAKCADKNTKRGEWMTVAELRLYRPIVKKDKPEDLYVVKDNASRSVGLSDGRNICSSTHEASKASTKVGPKVKKKGHRCDSQTTKLIRDLLGGAISYTRTTLVGGTIPTQAAINTGRDILGKALQRVGKVGDDVVSQVKDSDLKQLTYALYGIMPKVKPLGAAESTWILSKDNIAVWGQDLDAFETALKTDGGELEVEGEDPMEGMPLDMEWIDPKTDLHKWLMNWWVGASNNRNGYGTLKIHNLWKIRRHADEEGDLRMYQDKVMSTCGPKWKGERPQFQEKERFDLSADDRKRWWETNSALTFHGSRTVNIPGILRENLRLPGDLVGVAINGANFGPGLYFADDWQKSAGYSSLTGSHWAGGGGSVKGRQAFMIACDTVMGNPHLASHSQGFRGYPSGAHCIFGKGGHTSFSNYSGAQRLVNNEWIIFDRKPVLRYLAEFSTTR